MPTNTPNLNLIKPLVSEQYTVAVANANNDILDTAVGDVYTKSEVDTQVGLLAPKANPVFTGIVNSSSTDDATSVTSAPLKSAGGFAVVKKSYFGDSMKNGGYILKGYELAGSQANGSVMRIPYTGTSYSSIALKITVNSRLGGGTYATQYKEVLIHLFLDGGVHSGKTTSIIKEIGSGITIEFLQLTGNSHEIKITNGTGQPLTYTAILVELIGSGMNNGLGAITVT